MKKLTLGAIALAASTMIGSAASYADLMGEIWLNEPAVASNLDLFPTSLTSVRDATFTSTSINYTAPVGGAFTVGAFLDNNATNFAITPGSSVPSVAALLASDLTNSVIRLTGTATAPTQGLGNVSVTHDDGVNLSSGINTNTGNIIHDPLAAPSHTSVGTLNGAQPITLLYGECCGPPAVLQSNLLNAVPEPASLALLGSALVGFGVMRRRRKTS